MTKAIIPVAQAVQTIRYLRGQKVLLDVDLAVLYGVETRILNQAAKRNAARFPSDFMFRLTPDEIRLSRSQSVILEMEKKQPRSRSRSQTVILKRGLNIKYRPYAFTEQGVAMLSSVLKSERAVKVNIAIMRAFVQLRATLDGNRELQRKFGLLEKRVGKHDREIAAIIDAIRQLIAPREKSPRQIGFHVQEEPPRYRTRRVR